jgi:hypothetical protein
MRGVTVSDDIQVGDKVRVVLESPVSRIARDGRTVYVGTAGQDNLWFDLDQDDITVEVIEKRVTTFKPGDVVRIRDSREHVYTIAKDGYLSHRCGFEFRRSDFQFTSEQYELVTLHESPL